MATNIVWTFGRQAIQKETRGTVVKPAISKLNFVSINHSTHTSATIVPSAAISPSIFLLRASQGHIVSGCPLSPGVGVDRSRCQPPLWGQRSISPPLSFSLTLQAAIAPENPLTALIWPSPPSNQYGAGDNRGVKMNTARPKTRARDVIRSDAGAQCPDGWKVRGMGEKGRSLVSTTPPYWLLLPAKTGNQSVVKHHLQGCKWINTNLTKDKKGETSILPQGFIYSHTAWNISQLPMIHWMDENIIITY